MSQWGDRLARLPWTKTEVKAHIKRRYRGDEKKLITLLAGEGSMACKIHQELNLSRPIIKEVLKALDGCRKQQMTFANIVRGTFFKYYSKTGQRLTVRCPLRGDINALQHLQNHLKIKTPDILDEDGWVAYLKTLAIMVTPKSGATLLPTPVIDN